MSVRSIVNFIVLTIIVLLVYAIWTKSAINTTVLLQAGHEGRSKGNIGSINGKYREVDWNIKVTKLIEAELKREGVDVTRVGASIPIANTRIAVAVHFDGATTPCSTGASIGYDADHPMVKNSARRWKRIYGDYFPFKWHRDNFTRNLSDYYGFRRVNSEKGFLVLELGEITCDEQVEWLEPRLELIATKVADFILEELDR